VLALSALFLLLVSLPYVLGWQAAGPQQTFGGFLLNPIDGNSYLAKMRQGLEGGWLFTLPYTPDAGPGAFINVYYLFLGHLAGWLHLPLLLVFHFARLAGCMLICFALFRLFTRLFSDSGLALWAYTLALFGAGLGWVAVVLGYFTSDFWVAEAYPFLAGFTNPHFALGLALQIWLITPGRTRTAASALLGLVLALVYPFGWVVAVAVLVVEALARGLRQLPAPDRNHLLAVTLAGLPYMLYAFVAVNTHAFLAQWNQQNLTPAPEALDLLLSFSPVLLLAGVAAYQIIANRKPEMMRLAIWLLVGLALVYFPTELQRRFISGLFVPAAGLAVWLLARLRPAWSRLGLIALLLLSLPTNALILLGAAGAAQRNDPALYVANVELEAFAWLDEHAPPRALVLAAPGTGLLLPTYADVQVLYGHPFETVQAPVSRAAVEDAFTGESSIAEYAAAEQVDYVYYGAAERELGSITIPAVWERVYSAGGVEIFALP
jgi:hypothetical protein